MSDFEGFEQGFEQRLRATVAERSEGFEPSADLPGRITSRVRRRHVRRRLVAGGLVAAAAAVVVVVGFVTTGGEDQGSIRMSDRDSVATTTESTTPRSTTTTTAATTTTTAPSLSSTGPAINFLTPLNRQGIGPIRAGMTLRQAQEAGRVTVVPSPSGSGTCVEARFEGFDPSPVLIVETAGGDVMDGVVRAAQGSVIESAEGAMVGQSRDELLAALGSPTRTEDAGFLYGGDAQLLVFEAGGYAYGALVVDDLVLGLQTGDPAWLSASDGCPT